MTDYSEINDYLQKLGETDQLETVINKIGEAGSGWLNENLNINKNPSARLITAKKIVSLLLAGRQTIADGWTPAKFESVGLVRSSGKFEPVIYVSDDFRNATFNTVEEHRKYQKNSKHQSPPWVKAKFFFYQLLDTEIPNDMVNLSDESEGSIEAD
jgi:hypothetical protein